MSFVDGVKSFFGLARDEPVDENMALGVNPDGSTLYKDNLIGMIEDKLSEAKKERHPWELQWELNANFLVGNQFVDINTYSGKIEEYAKAHEYEEREVYNQIEPLVETRIANLEQITYAMTVKPATDELVDIQKARVATALLRHHQTVTNFNDKMHSGISLMELCGTAFFMSWWDTAKGEYVGKQTIEVVGDNGVEIREAPVFGGDIDYGVITPYEVYPESCYKEKICDQRYIILEQVLSVGEIYDRYGIKVEGADIDTFSVCPTPNLGGYGYEATIMGNGHVSTPDAAKLVTYFEKPSRDYPGGRMVVYCRGQDPNKLIYYGVLPGGEYPLVAIKAKIVSGRFFGRSVIESLIPLQRKYNGVKNRIMNYIHTIVTNGYIAVEGSIDTNEYEENGSAPGAILTYKQGFSAPIPKQNVSLPQTVHQTYQDLRTEMEYVAGVSQLMVSGNPRSGVDSGVAMQTLRDIDNTRMALTGNNIRDGVLELAKQWISLMRRNVTGQRACMAVGANDIGDVISWTAEDLNSYDIEYITENELVLSPEAKKASFIEAFNMGAFVDDTGRIDRRTRRKLAEAMDIRDFSDVVGNSELQEKYAGRENAFAKKGIMPVVKEYDDHEIHVDEHMRFVLQAEFLKYEKDNPTLAKQFIAHINEHKQVIAQNEQAQQMQAVQMQRMAKGGM